MGVVYMLEYECGVQYVGRTSRPLHVRIGEHVNNIKRVSKLITSPNTFGCSIVASQWG